MYVPEITEDHKGLTKILNNTQAARILFLNKVLLVEGQDDEYFFRDVIKRLQPDISQNINIKRSIALDNVQKIADALEIEPYLLFIEKPEKRGMFKNERL